MNITSNIEPLQKLYEMIQNSKDNSLTKKYLTEEIVNKYKSVTTAGGATLAMCVRHNAYNPHTILPKCANFDCFEAFKDFFEPIIREYNRIPKHRALCHPLTNYGNLVGLPFTTMDKTTKYVISTRIRLALNVVGFPFTPLMTVNDRNKLQDLIIDAVNSFTGEYAGEYIKLTEMSKDLQEELIEEHLLYRLNDKVLDDAGVYRDMPKGRGIYYNKSKTVHIWVNEEDHIRIVSLDKYGDLSKIYRRLIDVTVALSKCLSFVRQNSIGFLSLCPSNFGTALRASVHVKIPFVSKLPNFMELCESLNLQVRGTYGEHTGAVEFIYDLSNKGCLHTTEIENAISMAHGVTEIVKMEQSFEMSHKN